MPSGPQYISLEELPSSRRERYAAMVLAIALIGLLVASPLLPGRAATAINGPSFLTAYDLVTVLCDTITGFLLIAQFRRAGSMLLLCLAGGYLFTGIMAAGRVLTVPGLLLTENVVGATRNSSLVVRAFWMVAQPVAALTGLLARRFHPAPVQNTNRATAAILILTITAASTALLLATVWVELMPNLTIETGSWHVSYVYFLPALITIQATAVVSVFLTARGRTALTLWLTLALFAGMIETIIGWWFVGIGLAPARRYSLFFYVARVGGVLSTGLLLLLLLQQSVRLYAQLISTLRSLQIREERLIEQQRMEAIGRLAGGVAHDFNNLLTVITGNLDMLSRSVPDSRQRRMVEAAAGAAYRGGKLTRQMLTFARRQLLISAPHEINQLLREMQEVIASAAGSLIVINDDFRAEPSVCELDRAEFELAVLNIVVNARHAMQAGGVPSAFAPASIIVRASRLGTTPPAEC